MNKKIVMQDSFFRVHTLGNVYLYLIFKWLNVKNVYADRIFRNYVFNRENYQFSSKNKHCHFFSCEGRNKDSVISDLLSETESSADEIKANIYYLSWAGSLFFNNFPPIKSIILGYGIFNDIKYSFSINFIYKEDGVDINLRARKFDTWKNSTLWAIIN